MKFITIFLYIFLLVKSVYAGSISGPARVIDGDGLEINGESIRLFGIDAPESWTKMQCTKRGQVVVR